MKLVNWVNLIYKSVNSFSDELILHMQFIKQNSIYCLSLALFDNIHGISSTFFFFAINPNFFRLYISLASRPYSLPWPALGSCSHSCLCVTGRTSRTISALFIVARSTIDVWNFRAWYLLVVLHLRVETNDIRQIEQIYVSI